MICTLARKRLAMLDDETGEVVQPAPRHHLFALSLHLQRNHQQARERRLSEIFDPALGQSASDLE